MDRYWENVWDAPKLERYEGYILGKMKNSYGFLHVFEENHIKKVCDAACGFGAYSVLLSSKGYQVTGFDVAKSAIRLTKANMQNFGFNADGYIVSDITDIAFPTGGFDAVVAHAVIDHLPVASASQAINELVRIVKDGGLIYLSFDGLEDDDLSLEHEVLEDGSFLYTDESRAGLRFKHYQDKEIKKLLNGRNIIYQETNKRGERERVIRK